MLALQGSSCLCTRGHTRARLSSHMRTYITLHTSSHGPIATMRIPQIECSVLEVSLLKPDCSDVFLCSATKK